MLRIIIGGVNTLQTEKFSTVVDGYVKMLCKNRRSFTIQIDETFTIEYYPAPFDTNLYRHYKLTGGSENIAKEYASNFYDTIIRKIGNLNWKDKGRKIGYYHWMDAAMPIRHVEEELLV